MLAHVVIIGGGGREHALAWKLYQSPQVKTISMTVCNYATAKIAGSAPSTSEDLINFCQQESVDLVVIGPEAPLAEGLADVLRNANITTLGPSRQAAAIESSKIYAKKLMRRQGINTADFTVCQNMRDVDNWLQSYSPPFVIKADGLAAGKGVFICDDATQARQTAQRLLEGQFGEASLQIIMEQYLSGDEVSFIVLTDGKRALPLATCRDYKRLKNGDVGPNTGGMGGVSSVMQIDDNTQKHIMADIIYPALSGIADDGGLFCGFLYAGLMINNNGVYVLEFNCRLGDPEAQVILPRMQSDLYPHLLAAANFQLSNEILQWTKKAAVGVVMASSGYPENPRYGDIIRILEKQKNDAIIFHAGTTTDSEGNCLTAGGRVLSVVALGDDIKDARNRAYEIISTINFNGAQYRDDIAIDC